MIIQAYKCTTTGKLFEQKDKYQQHLRVLAAERAHQRKLAMVQAEWDGFLTTMGNTVTTIEELKQFIFDNWETFYINGYKRNAWRNNISHNKRVPHKLVSINFGQMQWSNSVSNSHSYPRDGVQNWNQSDPKNAGKPMGYPGWQGQLTFTIDTGYTSHVKPRPLDGYGSDYFKDSIINTGTGGGSSHCSYDVKLFASDFPAMADAREKAKVWGILSNQDVLLEYV